MQIYAFAPWVYLNCMCMQKYAKNTFICKICKHEIYMQNMPLPLCWWRFAAALLPRLFGNNVPGHTTRVPQVGFELASNGIQSYAIANLDKTSQLLWIHRYQFIDLWIHTIRMIQNSNMWMHIYEFNPSVPWLIHLVISYLSEVTYTLNSIILCVNSYVYEYMNSYRCLNSQARGYAGRNSYWYATTELLLVRHLIHLYEFIYLNWFTWIHAFSHLISYINSYNIWIDV